MRRTPLVTAPNEVAFRSVEGSKGAIVFRSTISKDKPRVNPVPIQAIFTLRLVDNPYGNPIPGIKMEYGNRHLERTLTVGNREEIVTDIWDIIIDSGDCLSRDVVVSSLIRNWLDECYDAVAAKGLSW